jgi:hypothetical protein
MVLLDHMAALFLVFWGAFILFTIAIVLIYIPKAVYAVPFPNIQHICVFDDSYSNSGEMES